MAENNALKAMITVAEADPDSFRRGYELAAQVVRPVLGGVYGHTPVTDLGALFTGAEAKGILPEDEGKTAKDRLNTSPSFALGAMAATFALIGKLPAEEVSP